MTPKEDTSETKRSHPKFIVFLAFIIIVILVVLVLHRKDLLSPKPSPPHPRPQPGEAAPNFTFPALDGKLVTLADYRGKVVLLNIWATWCPSCVEEMPSLQKLYQELKGEPFEILAVSIDKRGAKAVAPFMRNNGLTFPALLAAAEKCQELYGITGVPESFIIDKKGIVEKVAIGPLDWASPEIIRHLRELMKSE